MKIATYFQMFHIYLLSYFPSTHVQGKNCRQVTTHLRPRNLGSNADTLPDKPRAVRKATLFPRASFASILHWW